MEKHPLISIVIPTCERSEFLAIAIESIMKIDLPREEFEICVVDNASINPKIKEITQNAGRGYIRFIEQKNRVSVAENWNSCWREARGEWVQILHDDDTLFTDGYNRFIKRLSMITADFIFGASKRIDAKGNTLYEPPPLQEQEGTPCQSLLRKIVQGNCIPVCSVLVRRTAYEHLGGFNPTLKYCVDWDMWSRLIFQGPALYTPETLGCYRVHGGISDGNRQALKPYVYNEMIQVTLENLKEYNKKFHKDSSMTAKKLTCRATANRVAVAVCNGELTLGAKYFWSNVKFNKKSPFNALMLAYLTLHETLNRFAILKKWLSIIQNSQKRKHN